MSIQERMTAWIKNELALVPGASLFNLRIVDATSGASQLVQKFPIQGKVVSVQERADELTREIYLRARDVARTMGHISKFQVTSCVSKGKGTGVAEKRSMFPFTLKGEAYGEGGLSSPNIGESEPPTGPGLQAQLMRHLEGIMRLQQETNVALFDGVLRENRRLSDTNERLNDKLESGREAREALLDHTMERQIKLAKAASDDRRKDEMLSLAAQHFFPQMVKYLPGLLDKLLPGAGAAIGVGTPPPQQGQPSQSAPKADSDGEGLKMEFVTFFQSLNEEQREKILETLSKDQAEKLFALLGVPT